MWRVIGVALLVLSIIATIVLSLLLSTFVPVFILFVPFVFVSKKRVCPYCGREFSGDRCPWCGLTLDEDEIL